MCGGYMELDLSEAIEEMKKGKEEGFNKLYRATYQKVYFRARQCTKTAEDAEDVTQITFIEAYKNINKLKAPEAALSWLITICYNQACKMYRRERDKKEVLLADGDEAILDVAGSSHFEDDTEDDAARKETADIIRGIIEELPELQKMTVIAFYYDDMKLTDIAEMMDCSLNTVKSRLMYARKYIKDRIEEDEKKGGYKLHVFSLPALLLAIKILSDGTTMPAYAAEKVYKGCCSELGLTPTPLMQIGAGAKAGMGVRITATKAMIFAGVIAVAGGAGVAGVLIYRQTQVEDTVDRKPHKDKEKDSEDQAPPESKIEIESLIGEWTDAVGRLFWIATSDGYTEGAEYEFIKERDIGWSDAELVKNEGNLLIFDYRGSGSPITITVQDRTHIHIEYEIHDEWGGSYKDASDYTLTRPGYEYYGK